MRPAQDGIPFERPISEKLESPRLGKNWWWQKMPEGIRRNRQNLPIWERRLLGLPEAWASVRLCKLQSLLVDKVIDLWEEPLV